MLISHCSFEAFVQIVECFLTVSFIQRIFYNDTFSIGDGLTNISNQIVITRKTVVINRLAII